MLHTRASRHSCKLYSCHLVFAFVFIQFFLNFTIILFYFNYFNNELRLNIGNKNAKESESLANLFRPLAGVLGWPYANTSSRAAFQSFRRNLPLNGECRYQLFKKALHFFWLIKIKCMRIGHIISKHDADDPNIGRNSLFSGVTDDVEHTIFGRKIRISGRFLCPKRP